MKIYLILIGVVLLSGCNNPLIEIDQELRHELFKKCMELLPESPKGTVYNDWDEVVGMCDTIARKQAKSCVSNCTYSAQYM